ncbi:MAG: hypothetical protein M1815_004576 [Lichina confinis]|nr:MAG: hypothetical protein M1815_004576 [Lichina confinis]
MDSPPPAVAAPPDRVAHLHRELDRLQANQKASQWALLILTLVLVLATLLFAWALYSSVTRNLSVEKLQPALMERVNYHAPLLQRRATEAVSLAMPTYQQLGRERLAEVTPELRTKLRDELDRLPDAVRERLDGRLASLRERIEGDVTKQIQAKFGDLPPEKIEVLAHQFSDAVLDSGTRLQSDLEQKYQLQSDRLERVLTKFDIPQAADLSDGELQLKVVENAALLVVYLTRNPDELPSIDVLQAAAAETPDPSTESEAR